MPRGAVEWIEIPVVDMDASVDFYEGVFGWSIQRDEAFPGYVMFRDPTGNVGGGFHDQINPSQTGPMIYITVDDIDKTLSAIEQAGGGIVTPRTVIDEEIGWHGAFTDPAGNKLGLYERKA